MNVYYTGQALKRLDAKMAHLKGRGAQTAAKGIERAIAEGNRRDRLAGVDRYGSPVAKLRKPRRGRYRGATGPPLAPFGAGSRVVSAFRAIARRAGGAWKITAGWVGVVSRSGYPFLPAHDAGKVRGAPRRPIFGISPGTWVDIRKVLADFEAGVRKAR